MKSTFDVDGLSFAKDKQQKHLRLYTIFSFHFIKETKDKKAEANQSQTAQRGVVIPETNLQRAHLGKWRCEDNNV